MSMSDVETFKMWMAQARKFGGFTVDGLFFSRDENPTTFRVLTFVCGLLNEVKEPLQLVNIVKVLQNSEYREGLLSQVELDELEQGFWQKEFPALPQTILLATVNYLESFIQVNAE
jgi:hypothetical protein